MIKIEKLPYPALILGHIILTIFIIVLPVILKVYFYVALGYFILRIFTNKDKNNEVILGAFYLVTLEVFMRMNNALPFYEMMKYTVIIFSLIGISYKGFSLKSIPFIFYLLLLVPSIIVAAQNIPIGESLRKSVAFNLSGPVALGAMAVYCYQRKITQERLDQIIKLGLGPIIMITFYLFIITPSVKDTIINTASNYETSGGYGPNQVATVLGIGMFLTFARFLKIRDLKLNLIDIVLMLAMTYRAWVTFSRGGVFTAFFMIGALIATLFFLKRSEFRFSFIPKLGVIAVGLFLAWGYTSLQTNGLIDKRYANQDAAGRVKEDLSTGRTEISTLEVQAFLENPILGIGAGQSKFYRAKILGAQVASHNETSRLVSEHGAVGILTLAILIFTPLLYRLSNRGNIYFYAFLIFWIATINHSAMRIAAPSFFYGMCLLHVVKKSKTKPTEIPEKSKEIGMAF